MRIAVIHSQITISTFFWVTYDLQKLKGPFQLSVAEVEVLSIFFCASVCVRARVLQREKHQIRFHNDFFCLVC